MLRPTLALCFPLLIAACSSDASSGDPLTDMRDAIQALQASAEQPDEKIEVQHVLISFQGAARSKETRSKEEAEQLDAEIFARARAGEDFDELMKQNSSDPGPGKYPMTKAGRRQMVAGFGDVGFRLEVGEFGVAPYDQNDSPFGWHVIKRTK